MHRSEDRLFAVFRDTGDPAALAEVFDRTGAELLRVAVHLVGDVHEAEDLVQAAFVHAIRKAQSYDPGRRVLPWLIGILTNLVRESLRKKLARSGSVSLDTSPPADPVRAAQGAELRQVVEETIARLPEPYQPVLLLHLRHGLSAAEIAHALGRPAATVRSQLARGMGRLRKRLPRSFLVGAALLGMPRGLAAMRAQVLGEATSLARPRASTWLGGALPAAIGLLTLVLGGLAALTWPRTGVPGQAPLPVPRTASKAEHRMAGSGLLKDPGGSAPAQEQAVAVDRQHAPAAGVARARIASRHPARPPLRVLGLDPRLTVAVGDRVRTAFPSAESIAVNRRGHVFLMSEILLEDGRQEVRLYRSVDGGSTYERETRVRTRHATRGALTTGLNGRNLHVVWGDEPPEAGGSIVYGRYDTFARSWTGEDRVLYQGGGTFDEGFLWPDLDIGPGGNPVVTCTTGRTFGWQGSMRWFDGKAWRPAVRVNTGDTGVPMNVVAGPDGNLHFSYRTILHGLGHIAYRRFVRRNGTFDVEIPVRADISNHSSMAVDRDGNRYVLLCRAGVLELATAPSGASRFRALTVTTDSGYEAGNTNYWYYSICTSGGEVWCYYANKQRGQDTVFARGFVNGRLTPEFSVVHAPGKKITSLSAFRSTRHDLGQTVAFVVHDASSGREDYAALTLGQATIRFGAACAREGTVPPRVMTNGLPTLGNRSFRVGVDRAPASQPALLVLGDRDDRSLSLADDGIPGCFLHHNLTATLRLRTDASGCAWVPAPVPNTSSLAGCRLFTQWLIADPGANAAGIVATGSATLVLR